MRRRLKIAVIADAQATLQTGLRSSTIRGGIPHGVEELVAAIEDYLRQHNQARKPSIWTAKASDILFEGRR